MAQLQLGMEPVVLTGPLHQTDDPSGADTSFDGIRYLRTVTPSGFMATSIRDRWPIVREVAVARLLQRRIESLLRDERFDVIHAHSPALCGLAALWACRNQRLPFAYEIRSFWEDSALGPKKSLAEKLRYELSRGLETWVTRRTDACVGIGQSMLTDLRARGIHPERLYCVPNGVDLGRFTPRPRDATLAAQLGANGVPILGFIGTLFPWEGTPWLVRAAAQLHRGGLPFRLLIIGDGAEAPDVLQAVRETGSADYVSFVGRIPNDQIERYYSVIDVMAYPRRSSRITELVTPLKPLEAMACGKAVIGSDVGGIRELIEPEATGLLFRSNDVADFCRQVSRLLKDRDLRCALGERARNSVVKDRDWKTIVGRYETVYLAAIRNARARST